jgi:hypothetical protein
MTFEMTGWEMASCCAALAAAPLSHRLQNMEIAQSDASTDAV